MNDFTTNSDDSGNMTIAIISELSKYDEADFEKHITKNILTAQDSINKEDSLIPKLIFITNDKEISIAVPDDNNMVEDFSKYIENNFKGFKAVIYVNECWTIGAETEEERDWYMQDLDRVAENPLKDEVLIIYAYGFDKEYIYKIDFKRSDSGGIVWENLHEETDKDSYMDEIIRTIRNMI